MATALLGIEAKFEAEVERRPVPAESISSDQNNNFPRMPT